MLEVPDTGSAKEDLLVQAGNLASFLTSSKGKVITELIAEGQSDENVAKEYRNRYFNPRRLISQHILERGIERGELNKDLDIKLSIDLIFFPPFLSAVNNWRNSRFCFCGTIDFLCVCRIECGKITLAGYNNSAI